MLEPFVPWNKAFYMPLDGMDIIVHPPSDDPSKGIQGSASSTAGEITRREFHRTPLAEIVRAVGEMPVETSEQELAEQGYSVRIAYSHRLTPTERVQRLGRRFGFVAEVEERQGTETRWIFTQDGSEFPTNSQAGGSQTNGKNYHATGYLLGSAIRGMLTNAALNDLVEGYDRDLDEIEMQWDGAADNPFERQVDIDIRFLRRLGRGSRLFARAIRGEDGARIRADYLRGIGDASVKVNVHRRYRGRPIRVRAFM